MKIAISTVGNLNKSQRGFTYILVLAALVIIAILAEVATVSNQYRIKRDKEDELLYRGQAYLRAIQSYYEAKPKFKIYPRNLEDLISDPRFVLKRHLRALHNDPISNNDWRLIKSEDGGIAGVASSSTDVPLKQANFPKSLEKFTDAQQYSEWIFEYIPASNKLNSKSGKNNP